MALRTATPAQAQDRPPLLPGTGKRSPVEIVTVNVTSVGPLKAFLRTTEAHVVLAQEVKTSGPSSEILKD